MNLLPVELPGAKTVEPLLTLVALVRIGIAVMALVVPQGLHPLEPGRTLVAHERLLRRVRDQMDWDFESLHESFSTNWTGVGFIRRVQLHVIPQGTGLKEVLAALVALVIADRGGAGFFVLLEGATGQEGGPTGSAHKTSLPVGSILVLGKVLIGEETLIADVTLERPDGASLDAILFVLVRPVDVQLLLAIEGFRRATAANVLRRICRGDHGFTFPASFSLSGRCFGFGFELR